MEVKNKISINTRAYLYDPTRTSTLRKVFEQAMNKRFNKLIQTIVYAIVKDDCFGLKDNDVMAMVNSPGRRAFAFTRNSDKVSGFMAWLDELVKDEVLQISNLQQVGTSIDSAWTNKYISDSYKRGVQRARYEMKNAGYNVPSIEETGGISASMSTPFHLDRVGVLWTRTFNELKGVTDAMSQQISRVLSEGMIEGDNPVLLGRKLAAVIKGGGAELGITDTLGRYIPAKRRAQMIARTEIIRAHHQATIQEYKNWGLEGVTVKAEWSTVGDNRVCKQCESMDGHRFTLAQIENMIPAHPNCRCIALPYKTESKRVEQPRDEVADNFINTSDKIKYLQYKKEFDKAFKDLSPQDKNVLKSLRSTTKSKELYGIKDQEETLRIMKLMQKDSFESMQSFINHVLDWKYSTQTAPANALKYTARKLEKGIPKMVFRKDAKLMIEDLQNTINIFEWDWDDVYIKWRAFSQSYMEGVGIGNEMTLYRGMSGGTGDRMAMNIYKTWKSGSVRRTKFPLDDMSLIGYSSDLEIAEDFGIMRSELSPGTKFRLVLRNKTARKDVVIPSDLFDVLYKSEQMQAEREFILVGQQGQWSMKDIILEVLEQDDVNWKTITTFKP